MVNGKTDVRRCVSNKSMLQTAVCATLGVLQSRVVLHCCVCSKCVGMSESLELNACSSFTSPKNTTNKQGMGSKVWPDKESYRGEWRGGVYVWSGGVWGGRLSACMFVNACKQKWTSQMTLSLSLARSLSLSLARCLPPSLALSLHSLQSRMDFKNDSLSRSLALSLSLSFSHSLTQTLSHTPESVCVCAHTGPRHGQGRAEFALHQLFI